MPLCFCARVTKYVYECVYVCMYVFMYVCLHLDMCIWIHVHVYAWVYIHLFRNGKWLIVNVVRWFVNSLKLVQTWCAINSYLVHKWCAIDSYRLFLGHGIALCRCSFDMKLVLILSSVMKLVHIDDFLVYHQLIQRTYGHKIDSDALFLSSGIFHSLETESVHGFLQEVIEGLIQRGNVAWFCF